MIRPLKLSDREAYMEMSRDFYASSAVSHDIPEEYRARAFEVMLSPSDYMDGYILEREGHICGYAVISKTWSQEAGGVAWWLEELYMLPGCRGMGLGHEYFEFIAAEAARESVARLRLEIEPDNTRAEALYQRMGFQPLGYKQMMRELR